MVSIGEKLKQIRDEQYRSARSVAKKAGISPQYLARIERGESNPTIDVLRRLADVLGVNLSIFSVIGNNNKKPVSLINFIEEYLTFFPELADPDIQQLLNQICLRGRYPENSEDWLLIFLNIRRALKINSGEKNGSANI